MTPNVEFAVENTVTACHIKALFSVCIMWRIEAVAHQK